MRWFGGIRIRSFDFLNGDEICRNEDATETRFGGSRILVRSMKLVVRSERMVVVLES